MRAMPQAGRPGTQSQRCSRSVPGARGPPHGAKAAARRAGMAARVTPPHSVQTLESCHASKAGNNAEPGEQPQERHAHARPIAGERPADALDL